MMSNEFEEAFSEFLDRQTYDEAESALFDVVRAAFLAGWKAAGGTGSDSPPDSSVAGAGRRVFRPDLSVRAVGPGLRIPGAIHIRPGWIEGAAGVPRWADTAAGEGDRLPSP